MDELPTEISIVTLNCWGLRFISKWRAQRIAEIGRRLAIAAPAIVALQEVWSETDYESIRLETRAVLPYGKLFHGGVVGSGLVILSRWPIEDTSLHAFPLNGHPTAITKGDWFAAKGVAYARIRYGPARHHIIEVFNTHTHAAYSEPDHDQYAPHRAAQAWHFAKLLRAAADRGHLVIGLGDLNAPPKSLPHRLVLSEAPVMDAWQAVHGDDASNGNISGTIPTADRNLNVNGVTSDSAYNTWGWSCSRQRRLGAPPRVTESGGSGATRKKALTRKASRHMSLVEVSDLRATTSNLAIERPRVVAAWEEDPGIHPSCPDAKARRIDYVFAGTGDRDLLGGEWGVRSAAVGMVARHRVLGCSLSDHFSVDVTLEFRPRTPADDGAGSRNRKSVLGGGAFGAGAGHGFGFRNSEAALAVAGPALSPEKSVSRRGSSLFSIAAMKPRKRGAAAAHSVSDMDDSRTIRVTRGTYLQSPAPSILESVEGEGDQPPRPSITSPDQATAGQESSAGGHLSTNAPGHARTASEPTGAERDHPGAAPLQPTTAATAAAAAAMSGGQRLEEKQRAATRDYDELLELADACFEREEMSMFWRTVRFVTGVLTWVGCLVAVWFVPVQHASYVSFVLVLVGGLALCLGALEGIVGLLFIPSELRALREFEWEVANARAAAVATAATSAAVATSRLTQQSFAVSSFTTPSAIGKAW
ncbi:hypothetical protein RB598_005225 [Gaeumannomyces tritici]